MISHLYISSHVLTQWVKVRVKEKKEKKDYLVDGVAKDMLVSAFFCV